MPSVVPLSDGDSAVSVPDGANQDEIKRLVADGESQITAKYSQQAKDQGVTITKGDKVYSGSGGYDNTTMGRALAWWDTHLGGNAPTINDPTMQPGAMDRILVNRAAGAVDLPITGLNVMKHAIAPERGTEGDIPTVGGSIKAAAHIPEASPDAPWWQRYLEGAATGVRGPGAWDAVKGAASGATVTGLSEAGGHYFGEPGAYLASLLFGLPYKNAAAHVIAHGMADTETPGGPPGTPGAGPSGQAPGAEGTWNATMAIRPQANPNAPPGAPVPNFQGLSEPPPHTADYTDYMPSFMSLANPQGQRIAASLSGLNYMGQPIEKAQADTAKFIQDAKNAAAWEAAAPGGVPPDVSAATVGPQLTQGAQDAILAISRQRSADQQNQANTMTERRQQLASGNPALISGPPGSNEPGSARVDTAPIISRVLDTITPIGKRGDVETEATRRALSELTGPDMSWSGLSDVVSRLNESFAKSGRQPLPADIAAAFKDAANAEKEATATAIDPGNPNANPSRPSGGAQFRQNNETYARAQEALDRLQKIGGDPLGQTGRFTDVPDERTVYSQLQSRLQSPSNFNLDYTHPAFPAQTRANIVGQLISRLGENESKGPVSGFRPETFGKFGYGGAADTRPGIAELLGNPSGAPPQALNVLDQAARAAQNVSTQPQRFGLIKGLNTSAMVQRGIEKVAQLARVLSPTGATPITALVGRSLSNALESAPVKRAMANQPLDWADTVNRMRVVGGINDAQRANRNYWRTHGGLFSYRQPGSNP
jgi:hypothetical protein